MTGETAPTAGRHWIDESGPIFIVPLTLFERKAMYSGGEIEP
tara:strand:+ start:357 stop:482 length:126 start_codon:yes stop_codon:yes gene_type:complete